jgi:hypothetical protein
LSTNEALVLEREDLPLLFVSPSLVRGADEEEKLEEEGVAMHLPMEEIRE